MGNDQVLSQLATEFEETFGVRHTVGAYAPGRVEVVGNHTDYNEGFVLSAAINYGTYFLAAPVEGTTCRLSARDLQEEVQFDVNDPQPVTKGTWANYIIGVLAGLREQGATPHGFVAAFLGDVPLGAGLSSSAALEMTSGLALSALYGIELDKLELAKIGQAAEHQYAGVKCGLLDQISSLYGRENELVMSDFRSLEVETVPVGEDACFLMCNTRVKHALVDGEYNERRQNCEDAAAYFKEVLDRPIASLRDVTWAEWEQHAPNMEDHAARRSAHVIGECTRVIEGRKLLSKGDLAGFGQLMFDSHESSVKNFENSCTELDTLVNAAREIPGILGARLSGGGFGGSVVALVHPRDAEMIGQALRSAYQKAHGSPCDVEVIKPSQGACLLDP